jgi:hypothetical protein
MRWMSRYAAGEVGPVWAEIVAAGGPPSAEAVAVARELARRAGRNVARIHDHLAAQGYAFEAEQPIRPPAPDVARQLDAIAEQIAPVPLALRTWAEEVGRVTLNGSHPEWTIEYSDPLCVELDPADAVEVHRDWLEVGWFERWGLTAFPIALAPDVFHKADVSGGSPYGIELPGDAIDPLWLNDDVHDGVTFVGYLRSALLRWAGFPGWARVDPEGTGRPRPPFPPDLARLAAQLEPF